MQYLSSSPLTKFPPTNELKPKKIPNLSESVFYKGGLLRKIEIFQHLPTHVTASDAQEARK